ncbi:MAG: hypothetical protein QOF37_291, partial [Thermoleophilaceae bacterium]|nr:hypothetical protein [Thermoleophilaceae bacterium]
GPAPAAERAGRFRISGLGRRDRAREAVIGLTLTEGHADHVTVELVHGGRVVARSRPLKASTKRRRVVLRRPGRRRFPAGRYTVVVRRAGGVVARRAVRAG